MPVQKWPHKVWLMQMTFANGYVFIVRYAPVSRKNGQFCEGGCWLTPVSCPVAHDNPVAAGIAPPRSRTDTPAPTPTERLSLDQLREQQVQLEASIARLEQYGARLHVELMPETHRKRSGQQRRPAAAARQAARRKQGGELGLDGSEEDALTQGVRVQLRERVRGRDTSMGW